ncbi:MAG: hypothetical protein M0016_07690 [Deltaproteobacteria bacterium]|jgi:hypothetical protein|nr:hypothetical protein [Deltaproteobacteria bacterium]MCL5879617.1 hypothetical protein [Deltaproteobacteria bacterium]MDA8305028.1 hypothetical protein [Deltaproteobacteria bacterium]
MKKTNRKEPIPAIVKSKFERIPPAKPPQFILWTLEIEYELDVSCNMEKEKSDKKEYIEKKIIRSAKVILL